MENGPEPINIAQALEACRQPLLDTGGRSRLINFPLNGRPTKRWLRIIGENPNQVFERLVIGGQSFSFRPLPDGERIQNQLLPLNDDPGFFVDQNDTYLQVDRREDTLDGCLETISREAKSCIDETGVNMLYLAVGVLEWYQSNDSQEPTHAPLILIPVELKKAFSEGRRRYTYPLRHNGQELQSNLSLAKRLEDDFGLKMPQLEDGQTPSEYFDAIRHAVLPHQPRWKVLDQIVLAFFRFQKQLLYLDLDPKNWSNTQGQIDNPQIRKVFEGVDRGVNAAMYHDDEPIDHNRVAEKTLVVMDADSSQHSALCDITEGHDLVIEGPPGTGKSQTIINAIASAIASGKTVLFVAEKLAALTVVYDRMKELGLEDLCLNLHSDQATPKRIFEDLARRLNARFESPHQIESVRQDLLRKRRTLEGYLEATRKPAGPLDLPLRDVFWRAARFGGQGAPLLRDQGDPAITRDAFNDSISALRALSRHVNEIGSPRECPWWGFDCPGLPQADIPILSSQLTRMRESAETLSAQCEVLDELVGSCVAWFNTLRPVDKITIQCLKEVSAAVDARLCRLVADPTRRDAARDLLRDLREFMDADSAANARCTADWLEYENQANGFTAIFRDQFSGPIGPDASVGDLMAWKSRVKQSVDLLDQLEQLVGQLDPLGFDRATNLSQFMRETEVYRLISDDRILNNEQVSENFLLASTERDFLHARDQWQKLKARHEILGQTFAMSDVPPRDTLVSLRRTLRPYVMCRHRWFWREYRRARAELMRFVVPAAKRDLARWVSGLDDLETWQCDVNGYGSDARLVGGLGPAFAGWDSRWDVLEHLVRWGKTLASHGIAGNQAMRLVRLCEQADPRPHVTELRGIADRLNQELSALPPTMFGVGDASELLQLRFDALRSQLSRWGESIEKLVGAGTGFRQEPMTTLGQLNDAALCVARATRLKCEIDRSTRYRHALPDYFAGTRTRIPVLDTALTMIGRLEPLRLSSPVLQWLFDVDPVQRAAELLAGLDTWITRRDTWLKLVDECGRFGASPDHWLGDWNSEPGGQPPERVRGLLASMNSLPAWIEFCRSRQRCEEIGLSPWVQAIADARLRPDQLADSFDRTVHDAVARGASEHDETLRRFSRQEHEQIRAEFAELDRKLIQLHGEQVRWLAGNRQPPEGISNGRVGEYTQMGFINHNVNLQRPRVTLRTLVRRAGGALAAIKPCWMMSPLSVAQFIEPGAMVFHLLIMDEASQIKPADALGSVARAEQVVVVGDPKQMPPSNWMERVAGDGMADGDPDDATLADDNESILEWGLSAYRRRRMLKWHYRSQHESLIAFSNKEFYNNELVIFPAAGNNRGRLGLRFHHVAEGRWANRQNVVEAQSVVQAIIRHAHDQPDTTLGVATYNAPQMELIQEELDRMLSGDSAARQAVDRLMGHHEPLFIKNVENLQGDERDVILISYTYGPDAGGVVAQRFYPINTEKGWRRFNVLVTRARQRIEVFSSMLPEQITGGPQRPWGVRCMRDYLTYARDGKLVDAGTPTGRQPDSDFEVAVADALRRMGYEVHAQVGVAGYYIDLGVLMPDGGGEYLLGIECDGAAYHSAKSARDRDRLRQEVIERRGWKLHRVWSTDWFRNQSSEETRLRNTIDRLLAGRQIEGLM